MTCILQKMLKPSVYKYTFFFSRKITDLPLSGKKSKVGRLIYIRSQWASVKIQERQHQNEDFKTCSEKVHLTVVSNCIHFLLRINSNFCHFLLKETVLQGKGSAKVYQHQVLKQPSSHVCVFLSTTSSQLFILLYTVSNLVLGYL